MKNERLAAAVKDMLSNDDNLSEKTIPLCA